MIALLRTPMAIPRLDKLLMGLVEPDSVPRLGIAGLNHDSRAIEPGELFIALAGQRSHGMRHASEAIARGAVAIVYEPAGGGVELAAAIGAVPCIAVGDLSQRLGDIADRYFGEPSKYLQVVGITGTNGKTSCSHFLADALAGTKPAAVVGTLGWGIPGQLEPTLHTTPDAIALHRVLDRLRSRGIGSVAMEASSHGLEQGRLNGVRFAGALFTNLSRDHLDYHGTMAGYLNAKLRLVRWPGLGFVAFNLDDGSADSVVAETPPEVRKIGYTRRRAAVEGQVEVLDADAVVHDAAGIRFDVRFGRAAVTVQAPVFGEFNVENLLGALAVLLGLGYGLTDAARRLARVKPVPGRMERFSGPKGPTVVVDYAHTPDALEKALNSLRPHCAGALWVVFGCGGNRDRGKRSQMGAVADRLADEIVLTDDNPRDEDGDAIIAEVLQGCRGADVTVIRDRRGAITHAIGRAGPVDVVLVAGKGHETTQEVKGVLTPFDDRDVVCQLLAAGSGRS